MKERKEGRDRNEVSENEGDGARTFKLYNNRAQKGKRYIMMILIDVGPTIKPHNSTIERREII